MEAPPGREVGQNEHETLLGTIRNVARRCGEIVKDEDATTLSDQLFASKKILIHREALIEQLR